MHQFKNIQPRLFGMRSHNPREKQAINYRHSSLCPGQLFHCFLSHHETKVNQSFKID